MSSSEITKPQLAPTNRSSESITVDMPPVVTPFATFVPISDDEDSDSDSDAGSDTSTVRYGQESYTTFSQKVPLILAELFPEHDSSCFELERLPGGSFNRIIGVTVYPPAKKKTLLQEVQTYFPCIGRRSIKMPRVGKQYILRVPRNISDGMDPAMDYQVATLAFVSKHLSYPVPEVIAHDKTDQNSLGTAYMLQRRIPGKNLFEMWKGLNVEQQKSAVRQITHILLDLHKVTNKSAGIISNMNSSFDIDNGAKLQTFPIPELDRPVKRNPHPYTTPATPQTTREFLLDLCERRKRYEKHATHDAWPVWDEFIRITTKLDEMGFFKGHDGFHLCHLDFELRNLLAEVVDDSLVKITGILDWDSALFGPKFLSYRAPFSLWSEDDSRDHDEEQVLRVSDKFEERELKSTFEAIAGPDYLHYATQPEYIIARRMFWTMWSGIGSSWDLQLAEDVVKDFDKLYPTEKNS